jgi:hypothetical protein
MKKELYLIKDFYVGELYVSYEFGNLLAQSPLTKKEIEERKKINNLTLGGAIDFQNGLLNKYTDFEQRRSYEGVLTVFYKYNSSYICLHNGLKYNLFGNDFCKNLISMTELLPKLDYNVPKDITMPEAITTFNKLFKKARFSSIDNLHPMDDFYVGTLHLYEGYQPDNKNGNMYEYVNLAQKYMLYNSNAILGGMYGYNGESKDEYNMVYDAYDYADFTCLFLKQSSGLLNLNNNQIYQKGIMEKQHLNDFNIGESHYEWIRSFYEYLEENKKTYNNNEITIQKALKLFKR